MRTTVVDIDAYRNELISEILKTNNVEVLDKVRRTFRRAAKAKAQTPYTMEEINARLDRSEAQFAAGEYYTSEEENSLLDKFAATL